MSKYYVVMTALGTVFGTHLGNLYENTEDVLLDIYADIMFSYASGFVPPRYLTCMVVLVNDRQLCLN